MINGSTSKSGDGCAGYCEPNAAMYTIQKTIGPK